MADDLHPPVTVAITGASGAQYGLRLIEVLVAADHEVWVMISKAAHMVIATETDDDLPRDPSDWWWRSPSGMARNPARFAVSAVRTGWHRWRPVRALVQRW